MILMILMILNCIIGTAVRQSMENKVLKEFLIGLKNVLERR